MSELTADELRAAAELCEGVIDAPWKVEHRLPGVLDDYVVLDGNGMWVANCGTDPKGARFIAAARTLVPRLLAELAALESRLTARDERQEKFLMARIDALAAERDELKARVVGLVDYAAEADRVRAELSTTKARLAELEGALLKEQTVYRSSCNSRNEMAKELDEVAAQRDSLRAVAVAANEWRTRYDTAGPYDRESRNDMDLCDVIDHARAAGVLGDEK